jgi:hypothetical protein
LDENSDGVPDFRVEIFPLIKDCRELSVFRTRVIVVCWVVGCIDVFPFSNLGFQESFREALREAVHLESSTIWLVVHVHGRHQCDQRGDSEDEPLLLRQSLEHEAGHHE